MRLFQKFSLLVSLSLFVLPACGGYGETCGPGEIKEDGVCFLLEENVDDTDVNTNNPSSSTEGTESEEPLDDGNGDDDTTPSQDPDSGTVSDDVESVESGQSIIIESLQVIDDSSSVLKLRIEGWRSAEGTLESIAYQGQDTGGAWLSLTDLVMEDVDTEKPWAAYKVVGTVANDDTRRILFFTDPTSVSGQIEIFSFSGGFSELLWSSGILSWDSDASEDCVESILIESHLDGDAAAPSYALRLDCWDVSNGTPEGGAYTDVSGDNLSKGFVTIAMEPVEPEMAWADFKLVATMADETVSIVFFTDPIGTSGQFQILGFSGDYTEVLLDTGALVWGNVTGDTGNVGSDDTTDPSENDNDATDNEQPGCSPAVEIYTPSSLDPSLQDVALRFECWDTQTGTPSGVSYLNQAFAAEWQSVESFVMEPVDADNTWASYKLVATLSDGSHRIIFFTDPAAVTGQLHILAFSSDYTELVFDTGHRFWGSN